MEYLTQKEVKNLVLQAISEDHSSMEGIIQYLCSYSQKNIIYFELNDIRISLCELTNDEKILQLSCGAYVINK